MNSKANQLRNSLVAIGIQIFSKINLFKYSILVKSTSPQSCNNYHCLNKPVKVNSMYLFTHPFKQHMTQGQI